MEKATSANLLDEPVQIADSTWWVARRQGVLLENNIYLRVFRSQDRSVHLLIDPGGPSDLPALTRNLRTLIGGIRNVDLVFLNHQDPDVCYNAAYLQKLNADSYVICSDDTWRLAQSYGLEAKRFLAVERFKIHSARLATGHRVSFVPSPFCHFRGATMLYDEQTNVLFTGDLFGGLSYSPDLFADERCWDGIKAFHQVYMPSHRALRHAVDSIRELDSRPVILAPQHGCIIRGEWVDYYMDKLEKLPVGLDLFLGRHEMKNYLQAINDLLSQLSEIMGEGRVDAALSAFFRSDRSFPKMLTIQQRTVKQIKVDPLTVINILLRHIYEQAGPQERELVELTVIRVLMNWHIPMVDDATQVPETLLLTEPEEPTDRPSPVEVEAPPLEESPTDRKLTARMGAPRASEEGSIHVTGRIQVPLLGDRFVLVRELGSGGTGVVYEAWDHELEERVAIKFLKQELLSDQDIENFFKREIKTARRVSHPNVVRIHEFGEVLEQPYFTMELLDGGNLSDRIGPAGMELAEGVRIGLAVADGLAAIHDRGIIHRDLKTENILFDRGGTPKIGDFGIAKFTSDLRQTQGIIGTPAYLSPEQIANTELDVRSDIYSFGLILYELFTGCLPFDHLADMDLMALLKTISAPQDHPEPAFFKPDIPPALNEIIAQMVRKKPEQRLPSVQSVVDSLENAATQLLPELGRNRR